METVKVKAKDLLEALENKDYVVKIISGAKIKISHIDLEKVKHLPK